MLAYRKLAWIVLGWGILVRLAEYLHNRSLWLDEAFLALSIIRKDFSQLADSPDHTQTAPLGFVLVEKLSTQVFGEGELALRLFPLLCGIGSLFLFRRLAQRILPPEPALVALALFAISPRLIYFSSEAKPYSLDVLLAIGISLAALHILDRPGWRRGVALAALGALFVWFSYASLFVLAGAGLALTAVFLQRKAWRHLALVAGLGAAWLASFAASYFSYGRHIAENSTLQEFWTHAFLPFFPTSGEDVNRLVEAFLGIFSATCGLNPPGVSALLFVIGAAVAWQTGTRFFALLLLSPFLFVYLASGLGKYPFYERMILFLVPAVFVLMARGFGFVREHVQARGAKILTVFLAAFVFTMPFLYSALRLVRPHEREEIRPVMEYLQNHWAEGDLLYITYYARYPFEYYADRLGWAVQEPIVGPRVESELHWDAYLRALERTYGRRRVWLLFSHVGPPAGMNVEEFHLLHLNRLGRKLDEFAATGASVYLYDLSTAEAPRGSPRAPRTPGQPR